jgi:hypothetical protein
MIQGIGPPAPKGASDSKDLSFGKCNANDSAAVGSA